MAKRYQNTSSVPLALAVFLASDKYDYNPAPFTISTTTLLKPLRQIILPARIPENEGFVDLGMEFSNRLGSAIHDGIERAWKDNYQNAMLALGYKQKIIDRVRINPTDEELASNPDILPYYMEQRVSKKFGKWTVTGKYDFIGEGQVQDYKTTSVWAYQNQVNSEKQSWQGSIYRCLTPDKITNETMLIHHIFMDWKASMAKSDSTYPPNRFAVQTFKLKSLNETDCFIRQKIAAIETNWDTPEDQLPLCSDEDLWRSESVFKFYKNGDTTVKRSTKNFSTAQEANTYRATVGTGVVVEKLGQVTACKYCNAFSICSQKDALIAAGELIL